MLNADVRSKAIDKLKNSITKHESVRKNVEAASVDLFEQRQNAAGTAIEEVEEYVNSLANSPKEFDKSIAEYRVEVSRFEQTVYDFKIKAAKATKTAKTSGAAGAAAGVGVAALGPTAAMAVATTFGAASTGTAISALSGAAATNAALAWLGGGALAAGGSGMAGGGAFLALAGPVGWTIGGLAIAGSATYLYRRNKSLAADASRERIDVEKELRSLKKAGREIKGLANRTKGHSDGCLSDLLWLTDRAPKHYRKFTTAQKERLAALINHIRSLSELLKTEIVL